MNKNDKAAFGLWRHTKPKVLYAIGLLIFVIAGILYVRGSWFSYVQKSAEQMIRIAQTGEAFLQTHWITSLGIGPSDREKTEYQKIKNSLIKLADYNTDIAYSYLYTQREGRLYILADSTEPKSGDFLPPGYEYENADRICYQAFAEGKVKIAKSLTDRFGTWASVLVPVRDIETQEVIAVFCVDFHEKFFYEEAFVHTISSIVILLCLLALFYVFSLVVSRNAALKKEKNNLLRLSQKLGESEELFRTVFEQSPVGISIGNNYNLISNINDMFEQITGRSRKELTSLPWTEITHPDDLQEDLENFRRFKSGEITGYSMVKRYVKPDGSFVWVHMNIAPLRFGQGKDFNHLCIVEDITERMHAEEALRESERSKAVLLSNLPGIAYRCHYDREWTMQFVSEGCYALTGYKPENLIHNRELSFNAIILPKYREPMWNEWARVLEAKSVFRGEYEIQTANGQIKWVYEQGQGVFDETAKAVAIEGLIIDITERKAKENEIRYLSNHDDLTNLYNRRHFEIMLERFNAPEYLPLSVMVGDINGLRIINNAFGHAQGDMLINKTAGILQACCREEDIPCRIGGDEFAVLMPKADGDAVYTILKKMEKKYEEYNSKVSDRMFSISISLGYGTKESVDEEMIQVMKTAENFMYKRKLLEQKSFYSNIISSIKATMLEKSQETEEHAERLIKMSRKMGEVLGLPRTELDDLELLATLHDMGKVGISDQILKKPCKLSEAEWVQMKKHPEIGYRIAMSAPELVSIANYILYHHEHWDGSGYPQGLKEEQIPLLSRIIAIVDAYDAMTQDREYRKALAHKEAVAELERCAGTQFDPTLVRIFTKKAIGRIPCPAIRKKGETV